MRNHFLITLLLGTGVLFADDCKKISKEEVYKHAEVIFLGHVFEVSDSIYRIAVIEWYKGMPNDTLTGLITKNVVVPKLGSIWLIFGQKRTVTTFVADFCSGSKSLGSHGTHDITFPEIPPPDIFKNPSQLFLTKQIVSNKALNEFYFDIATLRGRKVEQENQIMKDKFVQLEKGYAQLIKDTTFIKWSMVILIFVCISSMILRFNRK